MEVGIAQYVFSRTITSSAYGNADAAVIDTSCPLIKKEMRVLLDSFSPRVSRHWIPDISRKIVNSSPPSAPATMMLVSCIGRTTANKNRYLAQQMGATKFQSCSMISGCQ